MMSNEQKIMAQATELKPDGHQRQTTRHLLKQCADISRLIDIALKEGLVGFLYRNLKDSGLLETLEEEQRDRLQSLYYNTAVFNLKLVHDLGGILELVTQEDIQVVLLQGIALLPKIYEDIGLRPTTDIDLWVLEKDFSSLVRILLSQGYQRDQLYPTTFRKGSTILDLRTHILWADRIKARELLLSKDQECIHHDTQIIDFEGHQVRCLNQYDQVLYLMLHGLKHNVERLVWLVDIKLLVDDWKGSHWQALINRARALGQEKPVYYILFLLFHLFGFQPPLEGNLLQRWDHLNPIEKKVLRQRMAGHPLPVWAPLLLFTSGKPWSTRLRFMFESFFPKSDVMRQIFPAHSKCSVRQLYIRRIVQCFSMIKRKGEAII